MISTDEHNTPQALVEQQHTANAFAELAKRGGAASPFSTPDSPAISPTLRKIEATQPQLQAVAQSGISIPNVDAALLQVPEGYISIELQLRDVSVWLYAIDIAVSDEQIAVLLPATMRVQSVKMRTKLKIRTPEGNFNAMAIGGNFVFARSEPELRVLSFARLPDSVDE